MAACFTVPYLFLKALNSLLNNHLVKIGICHRSRDCAQGISRYLVRLIDKRHTVFTQNEIIGHEWLAEREHSFFLQAIKIGRLICPRE